MALRRMQSMNIKGKTVFLRVDFNVPLDSAGKITDDFRIRNALDTISYLLSKKPSRIVLASHLGRPKGKPVLSLSLAPIARRLSRLLGETVEFVPDHSLPEHSSSRIVLLENLRFDPREKQGRISFARELIQGCDVYINDAFGTAHRKDTSVYKIPVLLPSAAGFIIQREVENVTLNHKHPVVAIFGPAKISDKIPLLKQLLSRVDKLVIAGGSMFTFLEAGGVSTGRSLVEESMVETASSLLRRYGSKIVLPVDVRVSSLSRVKQFSSLPVTQRKQYIDTVSVLSIPGNKAGFDLGPKSLRLIDGIISSAKTVVWNGPVGLFEVKPFDAGTRSIAKSLSRHKPVTIICGGDTVSAVSKTPYAGSMTHISTGGGASLELLAGNALPALQRLGFSQP